MPANVAVQAVREVVVDIVQPPGQRVASGGRLDTGHEQVDEPGEAARGERQHKV